MSKKVLMILTSPRSGGNSDTLAEEFAKGVRASGHQLEMIALRDKNIDFCKGCMACTEADGCLVSDDYGNILVQKIKEADVIVYSTPIYFYGLSGQMKMMLDRTMPLYLKECAFRDVYLLASAEEDGESVFAGAVTGLENWIRCFEHARLAGKVCAGNVVAKGDIKGHQALKDAYIMGKNV